MRALRSWLGLLGTLALAGLPAPASAQPVGSEFQVNTYTTGSQQTSYDHPREIASDASGNFVVVWESYGQDGSNPGVFGQRYDSAGRALGSEFRVNTYTTSWQRAPAVASDPNGNFVVVWDSHYQDGSDHGVFGQRYDNAGQPLGAEFRVNTVTLGSQDSASIASDASGNFVVAWSGRGQGDVSGVFAQRYNVAGERVGSEFRVNSYTTNYQLNPAVASDPVGNFVVVWYTYAYPVGQFMVSGQRFDSGGNPLGGEFIVTAGGSPPSISSDASGSFVVVWEQLGQNGNDVWGRRYDSAGAPLGAPFRVNTYTKNDDRNGEVAFDEEGNFVVVWESNDQYGQQDGVFGRRFDAAGVAQGPEFRINSYTTRDQAAPSVAVTGTNQFVVVWSSYFQDGDDEGVFGQRFDFSGGTATIHVGDLDRKAKNVGATWRAQVKTLVHDDTHVAESGALVVFNISGLGTRTCTTVASGVCEVSVVVGDAVPSLTFTVTSLSRVGVSYDAGANHDPDPDSNGTTIVVNQP